MVTRLGLVLNAAATVLVLLALGAAVRLQCTPEWRDYQQRYLAQAGERAGDDTVRVHEVTIPERAQVDRCTSCHLGMEPGTATLDQPPFQAHPGQLLVTHPIGQFGCTSCHGGQGRSLDPDSAHDRRSGGGWSAFTPPAVRCSRCHPAAGMPGTELIRTGVDLFVSEACIGCHQPGRTGPGLGPNLASVGLRGADYIRRVVLYPDQVYPDTVMPPLRYRVPPDDPRLDGLIAFLLTLQPWPRDVPRVERQFDPRACAGCHRVDQPGLAPAGPRHRCAYLRSEAGWMSCARCHTESAPAAAEPAAAEPAAAEPAAAAPATTQPGGPPARTVPTVADPGGACPELTRAFTACGLCHREGETETSP